MMKIDSSYYSCDICGRPIAAGEYIEVCSDCGAVFCMGCVNDGRIDEHKCEEEDYE